MKQPVIDFLIANEFERMELNRYVNHSCNVTYRGGHYVVSNNDGWAMYSKDENIYWLIGVLTYYGYIDKNYKQINNQ